MMLREPWRTRLLFISFAVNLFLAGLIFMQMLSPHRRGPPGFEAIMDQMTRGMPEADAAKFRAVMLADRPRNEVARGQMEAARREMSRAIGQMPYDEAAVRAAMQAWQTAWLGWSNALNASILRSVAELSPDGRRSLAEAGQMRPPPR